VYILSFRFGTAKMESCSRLDGTVFQFNWNSIPDDMEQPSKIHLARRLI